MVNLNLISTQPNVLSLNKTCKAKSKLTGGKNTINTHTHTHTHTHNVTFHTNSSNKNNDVSHNLQNISMTGVNKIMIKKKKIIDSHVVKYFINFHIFKGSFVSILGNHVGHDIFIISMLTIKYI